MAHPKVNYTHYDNVQNIDLDIIGEFVFPFNIEVEKSQNINEMFDRTKEWKFNTTKEYFVVTIKSDYSWNNKMQVNPVLNECNNDRTLYCICIR